MVDEGPKKPAKSHEEKRRDWVSQIQSLAKKLKNTAPSHREAAYWEQLEEDCGKVPTNFR
jgi:hypothetical protein